MALFYNTNGTVSEIVVKAIIDGKVTSSLVTPPTIQQAFEASASNAIINNAIAAGSSSIQAYQLGYRSGSSNNTGTNYLSSTTQKQNLSYIINNTSYNTESSASMALYKNDVNDNIKKGYQNYWNTTASLVINKITNGDRAALGLPSVGAHALPIFYSTASWADLGNSSLYSASIATGSIMKLSVSRSYFDFTFDSASATKLSLVSSNIHSNLNSFNTLSGSVSASVEYSHFVLFVSSSRALMGTLISEKTYISKPI